MLLFLLFSTFIFFLRNACFFFSLCQLAFNLFNIFFNKFLCIFSFQAEILELFSIYSLHFPIFNFLITKEELRYLWPSIIICISSIFFYCWWWWLPCLIFVDWLVHVHGGLVVLGLPSVGGGLLNTPGKPSLFWGSSSIACENWQSLLIWSSTIFGVLSPWSKSLEAFLGNCAFPSLSLYFGDSVTYLLSFLAGGGATNFSEGSLPGVY